MQHQNSKIGEKRQVETAADPLSRLQFCIVSENPFFRENMRQMVQSVGVWNCAEVRCFDDGIGALQVPDMRPVAFIVDCAGGEQGAGAFIRAVRNRSAATPVRTPVLAVTDDASLDEIRRLSQFGVTAILLRPFSVKGLMMQIRKVLQNSRDSLPAGAFARAKAAASPADTEVAAPAPVRRAA
jgi:DNA-binding NarL/FixJ family response regulator